MARKTPTFVFGACATAVAAASQPDALTDGVVPITPEPLKDIAIRAGVTPLENGDVPLLDFLKWLGEYTSSLALRDLNADGRVDHEDAAIAIADTLHALAGDLNSDGVVNENDVALLMQQLLRGAGRPATASEGDINADGILDQEDLAALIGLQGLIVDDAAIDAFAQAVADMSTAGDGPGDHAQYFSDTFPPYWPGPPFFPPFPPNHEYSISEQWYQQPPFGPPDGHQYGTSQNGWPPNHYWQISTEWPIEHVIATSDIEWPSNHLHAISSTWPDDHAAGLSGQFPPNHILPNSHQESHLQIWSQLHPDDEHMVPQPSPHRQEISNHWADHQVAQSLLVWPPNHIRQASNTWRHDHLLNVSITWPAGHFGGISRQWPQPTPPWGPNHLTSVSLEGGDPHVDPLPPLFPEDHTIFTTIREIRRLVPATPQQPAPGGQEGQE